MGIERKMHDEYGKLGLNLDRTVDVRQRKNIIAEKKEAPKPKQESGQEQQKPRKSFGEVLENSRKAGSDNANRLFDRINSSAAVRATKYLGVKAMRGFFTAKEVYSGIKGRVQDVKGAFKKPEKPSPKEVLKAATASPEAKPVAPEKMTVLERSAERETDILARAKEALEKHEANFKRIQEKIEAKKKAKQEQDARLKKLEILMKQLDDLKKALRRNVDANKLRQYKSKIKTLKNKLSTTAEEIEKAA